MTEEEKNASFSEEEIAETEKDQREDEEEKDLKKEKHKELKKEISVLKEKVSELEAKNKEAEDRYLRLAAEYENFRKRSQKEKEGIYSDAYQDCILNILPIADNLERAVEFSESDKVIDGVKMTLKTMNEAFDKMGISEIETKTFDPNLHNAVMHEEDEDKGEGEITQVFQKGYVKDGKVIRFAMVKVAN